MHNVNIAVIDTYIDIHSIYDDKKNNNRWQNTVRLFPE